MTTDSATSSSPATPERDVAPRGGYFALLCLTSLGIVYGDIGTSPLYAIRECFHGEYATSVTPANVLGVLSLIVWSLVLVISVKYLVFILRADNRGEGGILALTALARSIGGPEPDARRAGRWVLLAGLFGAALLYGDGMITPAISVLSAVEGLSVATPAFEPYVVPITVTILVLVFAVQRHGTARVGLAFGPVTLVWFFVLATLGAVQIVDHPEVLAALDPRHAARFFIEGGTRSYFVMGAVFLVVTGGEALYADMGHFGARPIRATWFAVVLPALLLNYFGQGALLLGDPSLAENPFYRMAPGWALYPLVVLATAATVIASQAVISGAYSLTMQAVQLGDLPRLRIRHTSERERGQIYLPFVNWGLMIATVGLVVGFRSSSNLAAAYGIAVTTTMVITTIVFYVVARHRWGWNRFLVDALCLLFLLIDLSFFGANVVKVAHGGWFPLLIATGVFTVMVTWRTGRRLLAARVLDGMLEVERLLEDPGFGDVVRVPGIAVFLTSQRTRLPASFLHNVKHNHVIHERVVLLTVVFEEVPRIEPQDRILCEPLGHGFFRVAARYGFMEVPDIPRVLALARSDDLPFDPQRTTYFLGREHVLPSPRRGMAPWREKLFALLSHNALAATAYFRIPTNRVVELGAQVEI